MTLVNHTLEFWQKKFARMRANGWGPSSIAEDCGWQTADVEKVLRGKAPDWWRDSEVTETGRRLLAKPPKELVQRVYGGDVEKFAACVRANFGELA